MVIRVNLNAIAVLHDLHWFVMCVIAAVVYFTFIPNSVYQAMFVYSLLSSAVRPRNGVLSISFKDRE